jgi:polyhydroxyalkanoate synthesis regulator protein
MKVITRYSNRKMYDKETSKYVTLNDIVALPMGSFQIVEHKTKKDITTESLLSYLGTAGWTEDNQTKIRVMRHCIERLDY